MAEALTAQWLIGVDREWAVRAITDHHYTHSVPSGKTHYFLFQDAVVAFSIPANHNIAKFLFDRRTVVWELSRLWAPNGHRPNLLTQAIKTATAGLLRIEPAVEALVSYADPNAGHSGDVYRAASWTYAGVSSEGRYYVGPDDQPVARRKFHSGSKGLTKAQIEALGYQQVKRPGKVWFVRGLTKRTRREVAAKWPT